MRKRHNNKARYFGPYPSGLSAKETLRFVLQIFPLRTCRNRDFKLRPRPCLEYQIGKCPAPCTGLIDEAAYRKLARKHGIFSAGEASRINFRNQSTNGRSEAENLNFEEAARLRDRVAALEHALEKQNVDWGGTKDQDVFWVFMRIMIIINFVFYLYAAGSFWAANHLRR